LNTTVPYLFLKKALDRNPSYAFIQVKTTSVFHPVPDNMLSNSSDVAGHFRSYKSPSLLALQAGVGLDLLRKSLEVSQQ
jgi:hypothetical protein